MKNKSKRLLLILLAGMLSFVIVLSGCGSEKEEAEEIAVATQTTEIEEVAEEKSPHYDSSAFLAQIPEWDGHAFCYLNGNAADFKPNEIWSATQESLDPLDDLGRCGTANSCVGLDGMPTEPRGDISSVEPSGWHTERYDFVEGEALFNRCHLIGHQLSGDDAVPRNLITGTSYLNRDGMLQFENAIASYVKGTGNHVMYRVTPVFSGNELIARGVHMQAVSVEDDGHGINFNVFCYNVQPGIDIDYSTGENGLSEDTSMLKKYLTGELYELAEVHGLTAGDKATDPASGIAAEDASSEDGSVDSGSDPEVSGQKASDQEASESEAAGSDDAASDSKKYELTYILNTNTHKFHYPDCKSVNDMKEKNKKEVTATREEIMAQGYDPCGNCKP